MKYKCPQCGRPNMEPVPFMDAIKCWWCGKIVTKNEIYSGAVELETTGDCGKELNRA